MVCFSFGVFVEGSEGLIAICVSAEVFCRRGYVDVSFLKVLLTCSLLCAAVVAFYGQHFVGRFQLKCKHVYDVIAYCTCMFLVELFDNPFDCWAFFSKSCRAQFYHVLPDTAYLIALGSSFAQNNTNLHKGLIMKLKTLKNDLGNKLG